MAKESTSTGVNVPTVVFIVFLILKLVGVISWSWWWVTSPLWICAGLWVIVLLMGALTVLATRR